MELRRISERISYLPASREPLSADVGVIRGGGALWVFDVGCGDKAARLLEELGGEKLVALSHFHRDHIGNMERTVCREVFCGAYTGAKLGRGTVVGAPLEFDGGVKLFSLPSTHSKGALGLEVDGEYAFLGDAVYGTEKNGRLCYNAGALGEMISALEGLRAEHFLLSHDPAFVRPRAEVLAQLKELFAKRKPGEAYIYRE